MVIRVIHQNGATAEFPDGTDEGVISRAMRSLDSPQQAEAKPEAPQLSELDQRMNERVAKEAKAGLVPRPDPVQYTPIGSFLDEAAALLDTGLGKLTGGRFGAPSYDEAKAYHDARQRYIDANASGLAKGVAMAGGVLVSPAGPAVNLMRGTTLLPSMVNAAATGAAYGGLYGAGEGEGSDRAINALKGAGIGTALGAAVVPVARGIGNAAGYLRDRAAPVPQALSGFERGAVNRVADDMAADAMTQHTYNQQANALGHQGMLADMGENLTASTEILAQTQGPQLPVVRGAMRERQMQAPGRIRAGLDQNLGPDLNIQASIDNARRNFNAQARPYYEQFHNTSIPVTPDLRETLQRIPASAYGDAQRLARAEGHTHQFRLRPVDEPMTPMTGVRGSRQEHVPTGLEYDYLKRAVDDLARKAERGSNEERIFSNLARDLRGRVDNILSPGAPDRSPWAIGRSLSGEGLEGREAAELGRTVFRQKRDPDQVSAELDDMSQFGRRMYRRGARSDLRRTMGTAASNFGPRGDSAARRALNSDFNRENLRLIAGNQSAGRIEQLIDAENRMAETFNQVMTNSATARRLTGRERLPWGAGREVSSDAPRSFGEAAFAIAKRGVNALLNGALGERAGRIMADQARLLTARGIQRDAYVSALLQIANQRGASHQVRDTVTLMLNAVGQNARAPLISSATTNP